MAKKSKEGYYQIPQSYQKKKFITFYRAYDIRDIGEEMVVHSDAETFSLEPLDAVAVLMNSNTEKYVPDKNIYKVPIAMLRIKIPTEDIHMESTMMNPNMKDIVLNLSNYKKYQMNIDNLYVSEIEFTIDTTNTVSVKSIKFDEESSGGKLDVTNF